AFLQPIWSTPGSKIAIFRSCCYLCGPAARGEPVENFRRWPPVRDFTYVNDVVCALGRGLRAASTGAPGFKAGTGEGATGKALSKMIAALYGTEAVVYRRQARAGEVKVSAGDPRQAASRLGFRAKIALAVGLEMTLNPADHPA